MSWRLTLRDYVILTLLAATVRLELTGHIWWAALCLGVAVAIPSEDQT